MPGNYTASGIKCRLKNGRELRLNNEMMRKLLTNLSKVKMIFTAFHTGTLSESSPKGADELSEIGGDAF